MVQLKVSDLDAIVTNIEGTTTTLSFVHDVLFPYSYAHLPAYLDEHENDPPVAALITAAKKIAKLPEADVDEMTAVFLQWIREDKKINPLNQLQTFIWERGYREGKLKGQIYPDAYEALKKWREKNIPLCVYSSSPVQAQRLLLSHTNEGDLTPWFQHYFDTAIGGKKEIASYEKMAKTIGFSAQKILFLSDNFDELEAAKAAGMSTVLLARDHVVIPENNTHAVVKAFSEIVIE